MKSGLSVKKIKRGKKTRQNSKELLLSNFDPHKEHKMRVYVPDKKDAVLNEVLKDLYLLRQEIDYGAGTPAAKLKVLDAVRVKLQSLLDE